MRSATSSRGVLTPLWTHAWNLGYESAKSLVTGQPADFTAKHEGDHLAGVHRHRGRALAVLRSPAPGWGTTRARSELIARTEVARAVNSAAIQCYRDHGVTHKHLLLAPDACDICEDVADDGTIPLDAPVLRGWRDSALSHPACRCCPGLPGVRLSLRWQAWEKPQRQRMRPAPGS